MATIGDLVANLRLNNTQFTSGLSKASSELTKFSKSSSSTLGGMFKSGLGATGSGLSSIGAGISAAVGGAATVAIAAAVASLAALAVGGKKAIGEAVSAEHAARKLRATLTATGGAAGLSAEEIEKFAGELQKTTGISDDATVNAAAVLATFKNIGGDVFKDTIVAAQDMSAVMGTDLQSSVVMLGKALNDPSDGLSKLTRAGVTFSDSQEKIIKTMQKSGNMLGAQKVMLAELKSEFGGGAKAIASPFAILKSSWDDLFKAIGRPILPVLEEQAMRLGNSLANLTENIAGPMQTAVTNLTPVFRATTDTAIAGFSAAATEVGKFTGSLDLAPLTTFNDFLKNDLVDTLIGAEFAFKNFGTTAELAAKGAEKAFLQLGASLSAFDPVAMLKFMPDMRAGPNKFKQLGNDKFAGAGFAAMEALGNAKNAGRIAKLNEELIAGLAGLAPDLGKFLQDRRNELFKPLLPRDFGPAARVANDEDVPDAPDKPGIGSDSGANSDFTAFKGSKEALSAVFSAMRGSGDKLPEKAFAVQQKQLAAAQDANRNLDKLIGKQMVMIPVDF